MQRDRLDQLAPRLSRRQLLRSAVTFAGGLTAVALLGCESDEAPEAGTTPADATHAPTEPATALPTTPGSSAVPTFDSNGVAIHYEVIGEGYPIVLVHGFSASFALNWGATGWVQTLSPIRQVVGLDARGHGLSGKPHDPQAYAYDAMPNDVIALMDHLEIEKADLFGYSMGAGISLQLLADRPERFSSVILGGIGAFALRGSSAEREGFGERVAQALLAEDPSTITDPIARGFRLFAEALNNDLEALAAYMRAPRDPIDPADLARVDLPVLVVNGADDALVGSPDPLAQAIPGARLVKIPDRDHVSVVGDARFKDAVVQFLREQPPA